ncbi:MAG: hypothetical protein DRI95_15365 [Bacteroidetes bacterium]|nr:MAG: hypothetical protein DRI95_15365 [Bacteroidota bacterium]
MKKLVLFGALALGMLSFTSDKANKLFADDGPNDCAVYSFYAATNWCNGNGGCSSSQFNTYAGIAYNYCSSQQQ